MIACVDVDYRDAESVTACVGIRGWSDAAPCLERVARAPFAAAPYEPGQFYLREMPLLAAILAPIPDVDVVVVDGYTWLATGRPGLGARLHEHLHDRLARRVPVVGVAKTPFRDNDVAREVLRGGSTRPLYVTAVGIDAALAAREVARMHGPHRLPTILRRVDRMCRDAP